MGETCKECGAPLENPQKNQTHCQNCQKERRGLYYGHLELRYELWNFLNHHGREMAQYIYSKMVEEEGEEWVREALGDKLVSEILAQK